MGAFGVYLVKSGLCLAVFYLFYRLLLSRETFHRFNRMALMGILLLSGIIPLLEVTMERVTEINRTMLSLEEWLTMADVEEGTLGTDVTETTSGSWRIKAMGMLYAFGFLFFLFQPLYSLGKVLYLLHGSREEKYGKGVRVFLHSKEVAPFSWMHCIVLSEKDWHENGEVILAHEYAHIRNYHSWDLLVMEFCLLFQWFNPAVWLFRQELQQIHEYEADAYVIRQGINAREYQLLLIQKAVGERLFSMANSLNQSSLKKRIGMMVKQQSHPWARVKSLFVFPLAVLAVVVFAHPDVPASIPSTEENKTIALLSSSTERTFTSVSSSISMPKNQSEEPVCANVDKDPTYPGGMSALMGFMNKSIQYPYYAAEKGLQGRVIVEFVVEKDGSITHVKLLKGVHPSLDSEAIRVCEAMPKWKPGQKKGKIVRSKFVVPILFRLA